jgi:filamentous hemagglutinin family protein
MNGASGFQEVRSPASRSSTNRLLREQRHRFGKVPGAFSVLLILLAFAGHIAFHTEQAHGVTSITQTTGAGDLGTQVSLPIGHVYGITGGTPVDTNLYHSFAQFNVGAGDTAQFQTPALNLDTAMHNILGRITDVNPSTIFGTIDSATYYPNANLFLMNPYGFLFGPNATVNVGGMVAFTSADYLRLANGVLFNAIPNAIADALLSAAPVAAFGFLGSNPGAITVQGSQLTVANGTGISLVGGNITIQSGTPDGDMAQPARLVAPNGKIQLPRRPSRCRT